MGKKLCWRDILPPKGWWREFEPAYVAAALIVFMVGISQQSSVPYLAFALVVILVLLVHSAWRAR